MFPINKSILSAMKDNFVFARRRNDKEFITSKFTHTRINFLDLHVDIKKKFNLIILTMSYEIYVKKCSWGISLEDKNRNIILENGEK